LVCASGVAANLHPDWGTSLDPIYLHPKSNIFLRKQAVGENTFLTLLIYTRLTQQSAQSFR